MRHDHRPDDEESRERRHAAIEQVAIERQLQRLPDKHVLRVADECRRRTDVGGAGQGEKIGHRVERPMRADLDQYRRHGQTDDVVGQHRRQPTRCGDDQCQKHRGTVLALAQMSCQPRIETAQAKLGGDDHQTQKQCDSGDINRAPCVVERHLAGRDEGDRTEQRDSGAIELEAGQFAQHHPEIDHDEDADDERVHAVRRPVMSARRGRAM